jgi:hypothetical protein
MSEYMNSYYYIRGWISSRGAIPTSAVSRRRRSTKDRVRTVASTKKIGRLPATARRTKIKRNTSPRAEAESSAGIDPTREEIGMMREETGMKIENRLR